MHKHGKNPKQSAKFDQVLKISRFNIQESHSLERNWCSKLEELTL